ncbi:hypothetical protein [uncultured Nitrospira sp.]|uniref:hypothetical protein n=1 Tax=uncultured Nitrospira sp. TaxID=157176 RepID=UPI0031409C7C
MVNPNVARANVSSTCDNGFVHLIGIGNGCGKNDRMPPSFSNFQRWYKEPGHGTSHAILEQWDVPLAPNRYPIVRESGSITTIYPKENKALKMMRMVAPQEALERGAIK